MLLEIIDSFSADVIFRYFNYLGTIPSIGDELSLSFYNDGEDISVKERYFSYDENGLKSITLWVK
jgi:hypothetical protein